MILLLQLIERTSNEATRTLVWCDITLVKKAYLILCQGRTMHGLGLNIKDKINSD